jgi:hypothetical protein
MCMVGYVDLPEVLDWFKSPFSGSNPGGNCVEVAGAGSRVAVRDSKDRDGTVLAFDRACWASFLTDVRAGAYELG